MEITLLAGKLEAHFSAENLPEISLSSFFSEAGIDLYRIRFDWKTALSPAPVTMRFSQSCLDLHTHWDPILRRQRFVPWGDSQAVESRLASWLPLEQFASKGGNNRFTLALADVKTPLKITSKVAMPSFRLSTEIAFFTALISPIDHYETILRIDHRDIPFDRAIQSAARWYGELGYRNDQVPDAAYDAVYSTWYAYMQDIHARDILKECRTAKKLGMDTVIVDDGWQNRKILRDYSNCGDWVPAKNRFPDMRRFTDDVHALGMKVMLWFSVPFIGWDTKNHTRFQGKYLYDFNIVRCSVLDPRYKEVRDFLVQTYVYAVKEWNLDGLKLDFIDRFRFMGTPATDQMDFCSVEDATEALLQEVSESLRSVREDILLEFRQPYVGPVISAYGNMLRVWDCPEDALTNRTAIADLRLISTGASVHSDMVVWNQADTPESAAVHLYSTLFSVPQVSMRMAELSPAHKKVLAAFLKFRNEHRKTLMQGSFSVRGVDSNYPYTESRLGTERIAVSICDPVLRLDHELQDDYLINLSGQNEVILLGNPAGLKYEIFDCTGKRLCRVQRFKKGTRTLTVPHAGMIHILR